MKTLPRLAALALLLAVPAARADDSPGSLEVLRGFRITNDELHLQVASGGCTTRDILRIDVEEVPDGGATHRVAVYRLSSDRCKGRFAEGQQVTYTLEELGLDRSFEIRLVNPIGNTSDARLPSPAGLVAEADDPGCGVPSDFAAIHNAMPPGPESLYVTGTVEVPSSGYQVTLEEPAAPGFNPTILILDLTVVPPAQPGDPVVESLPVRWDHAGPYGGQYSEVHIRCGSSMVEMIEIQTVH